MAALITLTTDFGNRDGYVGAMKGRLLSALPDARIIDVCHDIPPQDVAAGARTLARVSREFPAGTIHVAVVDPGVGSERAALLLRTNEQWFLGPDNGLLSHCVAGQSAAIYQLHRHCEWWHAHHSFDGLALFVPAAICVANGIAAERLGVRTIQYQRLGTPLPQPMQGGLVGEILAFDHFGNALTNIERRHLALFDESPFTISCRDRQFGLTGFYSGRPDAPAIAIINSDEHLELACYCGSAQERFGLRRGELVFIQKLPPGGPAGN